MMGFVPLELVEQQDQIKMEGMEKKNATLSLILALGEGNWKTATMHITIYSEKKIGLFIYCALQQICFS